MSIRWKLTTIFLIISLIPLIIFAVLSFRNTQEVLRNEIGQSFKLIAHEKANAVTSTLNRRVEEAVVLAQMPEIIAAAVGANQAYSGNNEDAIVQGIKRIDETWLHLKGNTPAGRTILNNDLSRLLKNYQKRDPREYGEMFITDRFGATLAMTATLTDYYQADEGWWREGFARGQGAIYIDDRGYDISVDAVVTGVVVPIRFSGEVVGLLKINFMMSHIPAVISNPYEDQDVQVFMLRSNGSAVIAPTGARPKTANAIEARIMTGRSQNGWTEDRHLLDDSIMGYALVQPNKSIYSRFQASTSTKGVSGESWGQTDWYVFIERAQSQAYKPLNNRVFLFALGVLATSLIIIFMSGITATRVTRPLLKLRKSMQAISAGNLDLKIGSERQDEIGDVLRDIDSMVEQLKETLASRDDLNREIAQRKTAEGLNVRLGRIVEQSLNEVYVFDAHTLKFIQVNKGARGNLGYSLEEMQLLTPIDIKPDFSNDRFNAAIKPLRDEAKDSISFQTVHKRKDGSTYDVEVFLQYMPAESPPVFVALIQDITERKFSELALEEAKNIAEHANKAKSEFLASMSHELRTPLNAVLGFAQMLQYDPKAPLTAKQNEHVESILSGGKHLLELVNEVLDLAKIEANQLDLSLEEVNATDIVAECVALSMPLGEPRNITIVDQFSGGAISQLRTDRMRFKQSLLNLLSNAIKYNTDGGTVTVAGHETDDGYLHISVTDTGIGIAEEYHSSVFHMFNRLGADPMIAQEGTGIGLTVTKLLVEQMAGWAGFESEEGVGSTFWIKLPLASNKNTLIWADCLRVNIDAIDKDHQVIISLLNRITHEALDDSDVDEALKELINYTHYHFRREEAIMEACSDPNLEKHRMLHQSMATQVHELAEDWNKGHDPKTFNQLRAFLKDWLFDHIINVDTTISRYTHDKTQLIQKVLNDLE